jgi:hypothetical protein
LGVVIASAVRDREPGPAAGDGAAAGGRPLIAAGALAAGAVTASGLAATVLLALVGWIAAPHAGLGLASVLRTGAMLWLVGQHVGFALRGAGRIGMLPLGLVLLPGALLCRAGRWVAAASGARSLQQVGRATVALAVPYALGTVVLAVISGSGQVAASVPQAALWGLLLGLVAGGLGAARSLGSRGQLIRQLPDRARSVVIAVAASTAILVAAGALLAGGAFVAHLHEAGRLQASLRAGWIGTGLLLLLQLCYVPNAMAWAISFMLGPGFSVGVGTTVAPTGSALGPLPAFPLLAAVPPGVHATMPAWLAILVLALPYLAGAAGGWLLVRCTPAASLEAAPLWGMASGGLAGVLLGLLAALSGGPLGDGRLTAVGPSGWQVAAVASLEIGIGAAVTAGIANYVRLRRVARAAPHAAEASPSAAGHQDPPADDGHVIFMDRWAGEEEAARPRPPGPSALP